MYPHRFKMLMAEADGSPGGGASTSAPAAPSSQAQGTGSTSLTIDDVKGLLGEFRNGLFADTRKMVEGMVGRKPGKEAKLESNTETAAPPSSLTREDFSRMLADRDAIYSVMSTAKLTEGARQRLLRAYEAERPDDAGTWARQYLADFGLDKQQADAGPSNPNGNTSRQAPSGPPVSNTGTPAGSATITEDTPLRLLSDADRAEVIRQKGAAWYRETLRKQMKGVSVGIRR